MADPRSELTALLGSRICHDLISPIGAVNNGIELLKMAGGNSGPEMELIAESIENASARILFFRVAFGSTGSAIMGRAEIVSILKDYYKGGRLDVAYGPLDDQPRKTARLVLLSLLCMETAMAFGGRIELECNGSAWKITGHSDKFSYDADLWRRLETGSLEDLASAHVQFPLLHLQANDAGRSVTANYEESVRLTLSF